MLGDTGDQVRPDHEVHGERGCGGGMRVPDMSQHPAPSIELMGSVTDTSLVGPYSRVRPIPSYTWSHRSDLCPSKKPADSDVDTPASEGLSPYCKTRPPTPQPRCKPAARSGHANRPTDQSSAGLFPNPRLREPDHKATSAKPVIGGMCRPKCAPGCGRDAGGDAAYTTGHCGPRRT